MKLKRALLAGATIVTTISPVVAVVACNKEENFHPEWSSENDIKWNGDGKDNLGILNAKKIIGMTDAIKNFPISGADLFEMSVNSKTKGILPVTRLQDIATSRGMNKHGTEEKWTPIMDGLIDDSVNGENGKPQSIKQTDYTTFTDINALWSKKITKKDLIKNPQLVDLNYDGIVKLANDNHFDINSIGVFASTDNDDYQDTTDDYDTGEYTLYAFKLKGVDVTSKISNAEKLFNDKSKMSADKELMSRFGGAYITGSGYGTVHLNSEPDSAVSIFAISDAGKPGSPDFNDRSKGDDIKSWFSFGRTITKVGNWIDPNDATVAPVKNIDVETQSNFIPDSTWETGITQTDMDSVKNLRYAIYYTKDKKTNIQNLVVSIIDGDLDQNNNQFTVKNFKTIYIEVPELQQLGSKSNIDYINMPKDELINVAASIVKDLSFSKVYTILSSVPFTLLGWAPSAVQPVIDLFGSIQFMYQSQNVINPGNSSSMSKDLLPITRFLKALPQIDPTFSLDSFLKVIVDQKGKNLENFTSFGAKRYQILDQLPRFYNDFKIFVNQNPDLQKQLLSIPQDTPSTKVDTSKTGGSNG